jgi:replication factor A1
MKINEMKSGMVKINSIVTLTEKQPVRTFELNGEMKKVADCMAKDETGTIRLSIWGNDADIVKEGDRIRITNGYVKQFKDELELSSGKYGRVDIEKEKKEATP